MVDEHCPAWVDLGYADAGVDEPQPLREFCFLDAGHEGDHRAKARNYATSTTHGNEDVDLYVEWVQLPGETHLPPEWEPTPMAPARLMIGTDTYPQGQLGT
jgi:hypothetical protein